MSEALKTPLIILLIFVPIYLFSLLGAEKEHQLAGEVYSGSYVLPARVLKVMSLEHDGVFSDVLFLKALVFYGSTLERKERPRVKPDEWKWLYTTLASSAELDPYFYDPYYFATCNLTWDAGMAREVNALLEVGTEYRTWDPSLFFYLGFNSFYFLGDNAKAADYLMRGSFIPGANPFLASLASRLAYKGKKTENAILFLSEIIKKTTDKFMLKELGMRLETLKGILVIEKALSEYRQKNEKYPDSVSDLVSSGIIRRIPEDPFGGEFYIEKDGTVRTTSDMRPVKKNK